MRLISLQEQLNNPKVTKIESSIRNIFISVIKSLALPQNTTALSISAGNGIWDYLALTSNRKIKKIIATDIVDNPIRPDDISFLKAYGEWEFKKVKPDEEFPFECQEFNLIFHQDVIEHTEKPFLFCREQYRLLRKGGTLLFGTPNLFRPANIAKLLLGKLNFPLKMGHHEGIGDYVHMQEFYEQQIKVLLKETGFNEVSVFHSFFGIHFLNLTISSYPKSRLGKSMAHYLTFTTKK